MIHQISDLAILSTQAAELRKRSFKPGFDGMDAQAAQMWLEINGENFSTQLRKGKYQPMPAIGFRVAKMNGSYRRLVRLTALDTIVQKTILSVVGPVCESRFSNYSHAYRQGRGVVSALKQYCEHGTHYPHAAKIDPTACFDNFDHGILENAISSFVRDEKLLRLMMDYVRMPVIVDDELTKPTKGVLQGLPLSTLLCNLYFHELDMHLEERGIPFVRYGDDIVIFGSNMAKINADYRAILSYITDRLYLQPNMKKCRVGASAELTYLGNRFEYNKYGLISLDANTSPAASYQNWHSASPTNNHRRVNILSDGILKQSGFSLLLESENRKNDLPVRTTASINIYSNVIFDTGALRLALDNGIIVNIFNEKNKLVGTFTPHTELKMPRVTHEQLMTYYEPEARLSLAKSFVLAALHNIRLNIRYYNKQTPSEQYETALNRISAIAGKIKTEKTYNDLLMHEAQMRQIYYSCFDSFLEGELFRFEQRSKRPPHNEVNAMLSYGNTVLYNLIATELYRSALDIRIGFLHATNRRRESLNLDVAEIFRPLIVDRTIFTLINRKVMRKDHFSHPQNGAVYLNEKGQLIFLKAFYEKLDTVITVGEEKMSYDRIIQEEIRKLARHFKNGEAYKPFKQVR